MIVKTRWLLVAFVLTVCGTIQAAKAPQPTAPAPSVP